MTKNHHHFVPQFYLRNFSSGRASISLINIPKALAVPTASIAGQCYRRKFYGETDEVEDSLAAVESIVAPTIHTIINGDALSRFSTRQYSDLIAFLTFQLLRTRAAAESAARQASLLATHLLQAYGKRTGFDFDNTLIVPKSGIAFALGAAHQCLPALMDLESRLLRISCHARFITSDTPVICYNQWCEGVQHTGVTGASCGGLQIFYPLAPNCMLMLFDRNVYDVNGQNSGEILLTDPRDVHHLNRLQCIFAQENVFFSNWNDKESILAALSKVIQLRNAQKYQMHVAEEVKTDPEAQTVSELLHGFIPMPDAHLKLGFVHFWRQARRVPLIERAQTYRDLLFANENTRAAQDDEGQLKSRQFIIKSTETWRKDWGDVMA